MKDLLFSKQHAEYVTITCLEWKPLLLEDRFKKIIIDSIIHLTNTNRITVYAFVIMSNHFHLIWQMIGDHKRDDVQRDFLKFTSQQIIKLLRNDNSPVLNELFVNAKDRKYQVWERNSLGIPIWTNDVIWQKIDYIHYNPVKAGLCNAPEDYTYSSAGFYYKSDKFWEFLIHCDG